MPKYLCIQQSESNSIQTDALVQQPPLNRASSPGPGPHDSALVTYESPNKSALKIPEPYICRVVRSVR